MRARLQADLLIFARILAVSALVGAVYGAAVGDPPYGSAQGAVTGLAIGAWCASYDLFLLSSRLGRPLLELAFLPHMTIKTGWYVAGCLGGLILGRWAFDDEPANAPLGMMLVLSLAAGLVINFFLMLNRLLGQSVLVAFITGRYHRPREEERIFLFADLVGSTATAERLGNARFHRLLNEVIMDLTEPVLEARGEIHAYVGDEVIVVWPLARGVEEAACVRCCLGIRDRLARRAASYRAKCDVEPRLRMALHSGPVVVGEMGDVKRQIVFLGDAVNATARLAQASRELDRDILISGELLRRLDLPPGIEAEALGRIQLRGRVEPTDVYALAGGRSS